MITLMVNEGRNRYRPALPAEILEYSDQLLEEKLSKCDALSSSEDTKRWLKIRMKGLEHEVFNCLFLDNRNRVIKMQEMFRGTINGAAVYPREVVKAALKLNAAAVIFSHNHPSGIAEPSQADKSLTKRLKEALNLVDIRVLDHIIIGEGDPVSFSERGLI